MNSRNFDQIRFDLFPCTMGLLGLALATRVGEDYFRFPLKISEIILVFGGLVFLALSVGNLIRIVTHPQSLIDEWRSVPQSVFFSAATISGSLLAAGLLPYSRTFADAIWWISAGAQFIRLMASMRQWLVELPPIESIGPTWLLPMVGGATPSFAGVILGHEEISLFMLVTSLASWIAFQPLIIYRIVFLEPKIKPNAMPSLMILVSAPAVMSVGVSYFLGNGNIISIFLSCCSIFYLFSIFSLGLIVIPEKFSRGWWGFTFPVCALSSSVSRIYQAHSSQFLLIFAKISLYVAMLVVMSISIISMWKLFIMISGGDRVDEGVEAE
jgi:tellurite resistance protein